MTAIDGSTTPCSIWLRYGLEMLASSAAWRSAQLGQLTLAADVVTERVIELATRRRAHRSLLPQVRRHACPLLGAVLQMLDGVHANAPISWPWTSRLGVAPRR